jgi:hypothetical protein
MHVRQMWSGSTLHASTYFSEMGSDFVDSLCSRAHGGLVLRLVLKISWRITFKIPLRIVRFHDFRISWRICGKVFLCCLC